MKRFMQQGDIIYRRNDTKHIWTTYGEITVINDNKIHIKLLDVGTDGCGKMWPITGDDILKTNIRHPKGVRKDL